MIAFADDYQMSRARGDRSNRLTQSGRADPTDAFYRNPAGLAILLTAATVRKRRLLGDPSARTGANFRPDPPDLMALRAVGTSLPTDLRDTLPGELQHRLKSRLAAMFQMIDELDLADPFAGEPSTGCGW
jgi:hypothetical protein